MSLTINQFHQRFPDDVACLETIKEKRFSDGSPCPACWQHATFYRVRKRTSYACGKCGHHVYPLKDTIFYRTKTPLKSWFYAMYLMSQTKTGVPAAELQRHLGVTYKCAFRMLHRIRGLMEAKEALDGVVEIDEAYVSGSNRHRHFNKKRNPADKPVLLGAVSRDGKAAVKHVRDNGTETLMPAVKELISPSATIYHDDWKPYEKIKQPHASVNHSKHQWRNGDVHTQNIENLWSHLKRGIRGTYRGVSEKYLQSYAQEYAFRYSHRNECLFSSLLERV